jgi:hypothetical protein
VNAGTTASGAPTANGAPAPEKTYSLLGVEFEPAKAEVQAHLKRRHHGAVQEPIKARICEFQVSKPSDDDPWSRQDDLGQPAQQPLFPFVLSDHDDRCFGRAQGGKGAHVLHRVDVVVEDTDASGGHAGRPKPRLFGLQHTRLHRPPNGFGANPRS